jgi:hypothetical protein
MKLFDFDNRKVIPSPEALLIKEFKDIYDADKSKDKKIALEELAYIVYMSDYKSPYKNKTEDVRADYVIKDIITTKGWKESPLVKAGIEKYKDLHKTQSMQLVESIQFGLSQINLYFRNNATNLATDSEGKVMEKYLTNVKKAEELLGAMDRLEKRVEEEKIAEMKLKGGGSISKWEVRNKR